MLLLSFYVMCTVRSLVQKFFSLHLFIWLFESKQSCCRERDDGSHLPPGGCILATNRNSDLRPSGNTSVSSTRLSKCVCVRRHCWYQESITVRQTARKMKGGSQTFLFSPLLCSPSCGHLSEGSFAFPTLHSTSIISCHCLILQRRTLPRAHDMQICPLDVTLERWWVEWGGIVPPATSEPSSSCFSSSVIAHLCLLLSGWVASHSGWTGFEFN